MIAFSVDFDPDKLIIVKVYYIGLFYINTRRQTK